MVRHYYSMGLGGKDPDDWYHQYAWTEYYSALQSGA